MKRMKGIHRLAVWGLTGVMGLAVPMTAFAASPEFARSVEEWERLRDDVLAYEEIADLIHEYNVTVQNNQYEYNEFIKDYGRTREDISDSYRDLASDLESSVSGDDSAMSKISDLQLELQAKQLREQADDNLEDSQIYYWTYCQAEDQLTLSAKQQFLSYYKTRLELESAKEELQNIVSDSTLMQTKQQAGAATLSDVLDTQERVRKQEKTVSELEQSVEDIRQKLIVMLGWSASAQPEIQEIPAVNLEEIDAINLEADQQYALEHNYTLKINQKKLENAKDEDNRAKLENTIQSNQRQIAVSVVSAWQDLKTAKRNYEQALADQQTEERNMELTRQKWAAGMITKLDFEKQQATLNSKERAVQTAEWNLLESLETYYADVNGLAGAE